MSDFEICEGCGSTEPGINIAERRFVWEVVIPGEESDWSLLIAPLCCRCHHFSRSYSTECGSDYLHGETRVEAVNMLVNVINER